MIAGVMIVPPYSRKERKEKKSSRLEEKCARKIFRIWDVSLAIHLGVLQSV